MSEGRVAPLRTEERAPEWRSGGLHLSSLFPRRYTIRTRHAGTIAFSADRGSSLRIRTDAGEEREREREREREALGELEKAIFKVSNDVLRTTTRCVNFLFPQRGFQPDNVRGIRKDAED